MNVRALLTTSRTSIHWLLVVQMHYKNICSFVDDRHPNTCDNGRSRILHRWYLGYYLGSREV